MENPPREILRVPGRMPTLPDHIHSLSLEEVNLITEGEEASGQHLHHAVSHLCPQTLCMQEYNDAAF